MSKIHDKLLSDFSAQWEILFENSDQAIYAYLDDTYKICNKKFSSLLGYRSPSEWSAVKESFPVAFVAEKSQMMLITAFRNAMEKKVGSTLTVTWKKKSGETVNTGVILVPIVFKAHLFALHFVS